MLSASALAMQAREGAMTNMPYTIYDKATGKIVMSGIAGSPKSLNAKVKPGQGLIIGAQHDPRLFDIDPATEQPVDKPPVVNENAGTPVEDEK